MPRLPSRSTLLELLSPVPISPATAPVHRVPAGRTLVTTLHRGNVSAKLVSVRCETSRALRCLTTTLGL